MNWIEIFSLFLAIDISKRNARMSEDLRPSNFPVSQLKNAAKIFQISRDTKDGILL